MVRTIKQALESASQTRTKNRTSTDTTCFSGPSDCMATSITAHLPNSETHKSQMIHSNDDI
jgi:hypothetical protein